jgi:hypothetical protein
MQAPKTMCGYAFFERSRFYLFFFKQRSLSIPNTILDASFPRIKKRETKSAS